MVRAIRALCCVLGLVAGLIVAATGSAQATIGSDSLTPAVVGYGTVHVVATSPPADCAAPASNAGGTDANVDAGHEVDCSTIDSSLYDTCTGGVDEFGYACELTVHAVVADGTGWRFDHWSGDCSGASTSCTLNTRTQDCDPDLKPVCRPWVYGGPFTVVAHFVDTRAPSTTLNTAPISNAPVYSDTQSQQFTWTTNENAEAPSFACKRDASAFSACSSGFTWNSIPNGVHNFCVHAVDASGLTGADMCRRWQQETNPTATVVTHPDLVTDTPQASFTYTSNKANHPADGSTMFYQCKLDAGAFAPCPAGGSAYSLLANGQHTFQVVAVFTAALGGGAHTSASASYTWTQADTTGPAVTLTTTPDALTSSTDATVAWTGSEPDEEQTFTCKLDDDPAGFQPCTSPQTVSGLPDGTHHLYVQGRDFLGNFGAAAAATWTIDTTRPTAALRAPAPFTLSTSQRLSFTGDGTGSAIAGYRVRYKRAAWKSGFGSWTKPSAWRAAATTSLPIGVGYTYCYEVQAQDAAGHVSGWSTPRCTARALDDRSLRASRGWTRSKSRGDYLGTHTATRRKGATLSKGRVRLDRMALVATRCPRCGTVGVYAGAKLIKKINLRHATTQHKVVIALPRFTLRSTTVRIKVLSADKVVQIDGLAVSRA
jgi:hypothetical protein